MWTKRPETNCNDVFFLLLFFLDLLQTLAVKEALGLVALSLTTGFLL